jgi:Ala-tRNA(Pro) deacylase
VAKSVLLAGPQGYVLAVLPATHQVDLQAVGKTLGGPLRLADETEIADHFRDCEWGTLTPFGTLYGITTTILDDSIPSDSFMVFEAQRHAMTIRLRCSDYESLEHPRRFGFARSETASQEPNADR